MKDVNDFIPNLISLLSSIENIHDKKTLIEIKKEFEAFIHYIKEYQ